MPSLRVGIMVDSVVKQQHLHKLVTEVGHCVVYDELLDPSQNAINNCDALDAWIVDLEEGAALDALLSTSLAPVILSDSSEYTPGTEEHKAWSRRMVMRLQRLSGEINVPRTERAASVWILAASTGGPAAVKEFLTHLPPKLDIAFIYVQHIDINYAATLIKMMSAAGHYPAFLACQGDVLQRNAIALINAEQSLEIVEDGTLLATGKSWGGPYAPSIDQVAANIARIYRQGAGLIIFSGMGNDGARSCRLIRQQSGQVWVQTPASCTSASMPDAALATQCVDFCGTPKELASHLASFSQTLLSNNQPEGKRSHESSTTNRR